MAFRRRHGKTMRKTTTKRTSGRRDAIPNVNFLTVNGVTLSLGDIRKADFSQISNPKASVKSIQETLISILDVLRGFSEV